MLDDPSETITILTGDSNHCLELLPAQSVHTCVTSPPYFGLRDYGHDGQIGTEDTPDAYVARLVEVFRSVYRVLRDDGTVWLNLGDSYAQQGGRGEQGVTSAREGRSNVRAQEKRSSTRPPDGLKPKDLIGIPWRVAFALQADGWYLRQDIIWHKPNPMPESVRDRCTKSHEYVFLLSKSSRYYFDGEAIKEPGTNRPPGNKKATKAGRAYDEGAEYHRTSAGLHNIGAVEKRNRRSVWTVTTRPYKGAHFATFPPALIEPCILAGAPVGGIVLDPFFGSGTTGLVAREHGRRCVGIDISPEYVTLAKERLGLA